LFDEDKAVVGMFRNGLLKSGLVHEFLVVARRKHEKMSIFLPIVVQKIELCVDSRTFTEERELHD
jgi:hypothetical protein